MPILPFQEHCAKFLHRSEQNRFFLASPRPFDHIHSAELANRFLNQPKARHGAIDELTEEL
jgi:hypothetical protein